VRVPCSTSNLGAGFDCLGLAFRRYLDAGYIPGRNPLRIQRAGTLAGLEVEDGDDVLVRAFRSELARQGHEGSTGTVVMRSTIPVGRGLGSSGAAAVAGVALARAASGKPLDRADALTAAVRLEGHPDNAAPALFGGLVAAVYATHGVPRALRLPLSERVGFVFAAPNATVSTQRARAALPQHVAHSAAVRNQGRMAALLFGLAHADEEAIRAGFVDELHVPYRLPLIPGANEAMRAAEQAGAWATTISGSGSGLIAACDPSSGSAVCAALMNAFQRASGGSDGFIAEPDLSGAQPRDLVTLMDSLPES
jgi:homoserine kinase